MFTDNSKQQNKKDERLPDIRWFYPLLFIAMGFLFYTVYSEFNLGLQISIKYSPLVDAAAEMKFETTMANMLFEKILSNEKDVKIELVYEHLDISDWYAKAMLEGGKNAKGTFLAVNDPFSWALINKIRSQISGLRLLIAEQWQHARETGTILTKNQEHDRLFLDFLSRSDELEKAMQYHIMQDMRKFQQTRTVLLISEVLLLFLFVTMIFLVEKKRASNFKEIQKARFQAEAREQWLKVTMRSMGDALITTDTTARVTYLNPVASNLTGWTMEESIGQDIHEIFNIVNEKTRKPVVNPVKEVLKRKYIVGLANHTVLISKNGKEYPIADSGAPIIDTEGHCIGTVLVFHDVSERVEAENKLRKAQQEWERSFNAIKDIMTIQDKDMHIIKVNAAACSLFKVKEEDLIGRYCYEILSGVSEPCQKCPILEARQDYQRHDTIIKHKKLGKTFQASIAPVFDENLDLEYFVHSVIDITEKIKMQEDLFHARKMEAIGTLAGGIAHDFNNILMSIIGYAELAAEDVKNGKDVKADHLAQIKTSGLRAKDLVQQILTFSRKGTDELCAPMDPHFIVHGSGYKEVCLKTS